MNLPSSSTGSDDGVVVLGLGLHAKSDTQNFRFLHKGFSGHSGSSIGPKVVDSVVAVGRGLHGIGARAPFGKLIGFSGHSGSSTGAEDVTAVVGRGLQGMGHLKGGLHNGFSGHNGSAALALATFANPKTNKTPKITNSTATNLILY